MVGEVLPEHEKPQNSGNANVAQRWLSADFMKRFSEISDERHKQVSDAEGKFAARMTESLPKSENNSTETLMDELAFIGGTILVPELAPELRALVVSDVVFAGSPYDKKNQRIRVAW
jgi:hypothetical protein